jgi:GH15 family glucan-1,4-alpha-glucosidase
MSERVYPPLADYALIGDCHTAALVSRTGSVDWMCAPRFDSGSCFGRLLDWKTGGYCLVAPAGEPGDTRRRYLDDTLVLETVFEGEQGEVALVDCMLMPPPQRRGAERRLLLRVVEGRGGDVPLRIEVAPRFDYGEVEPGSATTDKASTAPAAATQHCSSRARLRSSRSRARRASRQS